MLRPNSVAKTTTGKTSPSAACWIKFDGKRCSAISQDAGLVILFILVASGQIKLRKIDGWEDISLVLSQQARRMEKKVA